MPKYDILVNVMKNVRGFTILETVIAMAIIALASVAAFRFMVYCHGFTMECETKLAALNTARGLMEEAYMDPDPQEKTLLRIGLPSGHDVDREVTVADMPNFGYRKITVTVSWD